MTEKRNNRAANHLSRRQFLQVSGLGFSAAALLAACGVPVSPSAAPAGDGAAAGEAMSGGTLGLMGHQEVAGLSPENWGPSVQTTMIRAIHDSLMLLDENLENQLVLADSLDVAEDGLTYTFTLKQGRHVPRWHRINGERCPIHDGLLPQSR